MFTIFLNIRILSLKNLENTGKSDLAAVWKSYDTSAAYDEDEVIVVPPTLQEPEDDNMIVITLAVLFSLLGTLALAAAVYIFLCK